MTLFMFSKPCQRPNPSKHWGWTVTGAAPISSLTCKAPASCTNWHSCTGTSQKHLVKATLRERWEGLLPWQDPLFTPESEDTTTNQSTSSSALSVAFCPTPIWDAQFGYQEKEFLYYFYYRLNLVACVPDDKALDVYSQTPQPCWEAGRVSTERPAEPMFHRRKGAASCSFDLPEASQWHQPSWAGQEPTFSATQSKVHFPENPGRKPSSSLYLRVGPESTQTQEHRKLFSME